MQAISTHRTIASVSSGRQCSSRSVSQAKLSPAALRCSRLTLVRAEADNTGESITNSGQTKNKDSYEVCVMTYCDPGTLLLAHASVAPVHVSVCVISDTLIVQGAS